MALYTIGDGWTGALGTGSYDSIAAGHDDEDDPDEPFLIHDAPVSAAAAGWGHTAFVSQGKLHVCGRAHELQSLLRLKRFPNFLRMFAVNHSHKYNHDDDDDQLVTASPSIAGKFIALIIGSDKGPDGDWDPARRYSSLPSPTVVPLPNGELCSLQNRCLDAAGGLTALISENGHLYTFGMNHHGQCGIGQDSTNVWTPQRVKGLSSQFATEGRMNLAQEYPITQVVLGLQHGVALNTEGHVYVWGKAERGQLGLKDNDKSFVPFASRLTCFRTRDVGGAQQWSHDISITAVAAGMNHCAARSIDNTVYVWGKNIAQPTETSRIVQDSKVPIPVLGLPESKEVIDISCGSHHTAMLLDDGSVYAIGVGTDDVKPIFHAIELIPAGIVEMPVRQFQAHFDRTTIVGKNGDQVLQAHLWSNDELRSFAAFTPTWMDHFSNNIKSVHRGWVHTVVVTED